LLLIGNVVNQLFFSTNSPVVARIPAFRDDYSLLFNGSTGVYSGDGSFPKMENFTYKGILLNKGQNRGGFGFVIFPSSISTLRAGGLARIVPTQPISGLASFSNP
jgi:hypothetical protein